MALYTANTGDRTAVIIDDETRLWLSRMLVGEGGSNCTRDKASAMLWALTNRYLLHPGRQHWTSFLHMVRLFSQPINPHWQRGGKYALKHAGTAACTEARFRRRERICALEYETIPWDIAHYVIEFRLGKLTPPKEVIELDRNRISNWASHKGLPKKYPWGIAMTKVNQPDWCFEDSNLDDGVVFIDHWSKEPF